ncbi:MAG: alpha-glucan family phosphorylase, partial [Gemmatimonadetes bacterium]|nr:alpha-glucan family phosphorylase [Gemmatimonadota bacterium]
MSTQSPRRLVYLSMEIALENGIPTYSGGLGVLAGDTVRAAADLSLPMVAVSLAHREGYFSQSLDEEGGQAEAPDPWDPAERCKPVDAGISVRLQGRDLRLQAWRYDVRGTRGGAVPVYLLDADVEGNHEEDRRLTDRLYGGDSRYRLCQEALLGYGAVALMAALGHARIHTWHMNEGHCALTPLALLEDRVGEGGLSAAGPRQDASVRRRCVFTTHTPVPAGHDRFPADLVESVLGEDRAAAVRSRGTEPGGVLNMTLLGLHFARFVNGVAMRHARVSREMFPGREVHAITNGVHVGTWTAPPMARLFDRHVPEWREDPL